MFLSCFVSMILDFVNASEKEKGAVKYFHTQKGRIGRRSNRNKESLQDEGLVGGKM